MKILQRKGKRFKGYTIGLDLHLSFIEVVVLDKQGNEIDNRRIKFRKDALEKLLLDWKKRGDVQVVFEACGCFVWVFDESERLLGRERVHAAHAAKIGMIAKSGDKNDHNDAWWLAYLLYERRLPEAFVAEGELRDLRHAGRELRFYTDLRSDLIRRVRSSLAQLGEKLSKGWHTSALKRTAAKELIDSIPGVRGDALRDLYTQIASLGELISKWNRTVKKLCLAFPEIRTMMQEMPGMKTILAGLVYGELGSPKRFDSAKAYANATGMTPGRRATGGKTQMLPITRAGSRLARWALTRAVIACTRCTKKETGVRVKKWLEKQVARHKPKRKAIVAAARKMAEGVWRLMAWGEVFDLKRAFPA